MTLHSATIESHMAWRGGIACDYLEERVKATEDFRRRVVGDYSPRGGFIKVRRTTLDPILGSFDVPDPTAVCPTPAQLSACLKAGGLILHSDIREAAAHRAIAMVLARLISSKEHEVASGEINHHRERADEIFSECQFSIDLNGDGVPDMLIGWGISDVVLLPTGTAP